MDKRLKCVNIVESTQNESRYELLKWINQSLKKNFKNVEALCTGTCYCQLMSFLFPGSIDLKKVNVHATGRLQCISNWRILQLSFQLVGCNKIIPVEKLVSGSSQENYQFLNFFKKFYQANSIQKKNPQLAEASSDVKKAQLKGDLRSQKIDQEKLQALLTACEKAERINKESVETLEAAKRVVTEAKEICNNIQSNCKILVDKKDLEIKFLKEELKKTKELINAAATNEVLVYGKTLKELHIEYTKFQKEVDQLKIENSKLTQELQQLTKFSEDRNEKMKRLIITSENMEVLMSKQLANKEQEIELLKAELKNSKDESSTSGLLDLSITPTELNLEYMRLLEELDQQKKENSNLMEELKQIEDIKEFTKKWDVLEKERNFFYNKLKKIEELLMNLDLEAVDKSTLVREIFSELHATIEEEEETTNN